MKELVISFWEQSGTMENPDLVLQETGSRPTYSRLNYVPSRDTLGRDAISSLLLILEVWDVKPTCRILWAGNLLMWSDLTLSPSIKVKRWFTGFGELSFRWIQICIGSLMHRYIFIFICFLYVVSISKCW